MQPRAVQRDTCLCGEKIEELAVERLDDIRLLRKEFEDCDYTRHFAVDLEGNAGGHAGTARALVGGDVRLAARRDRTDDAVAEPNLAHVIERFVEPPAELQHITPRHSLENREIFG